MVGLSPPLMLSRPRQATRFLTHQAEVLEDCARSLKAYPELVVEPLDFFYRTLRCLGALDARLLADLTRVCGWRGTAWGGWLSLMRPEQAHIDALRHGLRAHGSSAWAQRCALAHLGVEPLPSELEALASLAHSCRDALDGVEAPALFLRQSPSAAELECLQIERARLRALYHSAGPDVAHTALRESPLWSTICPYLTWHKGQLKQGRQ